MARARTYPGRPVRLIVAAAAGNASGIRPNSTGIGRAGDGLSVCSLGGIFPLLLASRMKGGFFRAAGSVGVEDCRHLSQLQVRAADRIGSPHNDDGSLNDLVGRG